MQGGKAVSINQEFLSSSKKWDYETPPKLWNPLSKIFNFILDAAADERNHKCERYLTMEDDALGQDWVVGPGEQWWLNPPWGKEYKIATGKTIEDWTRHALKQYRKGYEGVMICSARLGAQWWHGYCLEAPYYLFPRGRVKFIDPDTKKVYRQPTFPSVLTIYVPVLSVEQIKRLRNIGWLVQTVKAFHSTPERKPGGFGGYAKVPYTFI